MTFSTLTYPRVPPMVSAETTMGFLSAFGVAFAGWSLLQSPYFVRKKRSEFLNRKICWIGKISPVFKTFFGPYYNKLKRNILYLRGNFLI